MLIKLEAGATPTQEFKSEKSNTSCLEEIESGNATIHPDPEETRSCSSLIEEERHLRRRRKENQRANRERKEEGGKFKVN